MVAPQLQQARLKGNSFCSAKKSQNRLQREQFLFNLKTVRFHYSLRGDSSREQEFLFLQSLIIEQYFIGPSSSYNLYSLLYPKLDLIEACQDTVELLPNPLAVKINYLKEGSTPFFFDRIGRSPKSRCYLALLEMHCGPNTQRSTHMKKCLIL